MKAIAVDDEELTLNLLSELIREAEPNIELSTFHDAESALSYLEKEPCDVAFLDIEMKDMTGVELARRVKVLHPKTNVIFSTAHEEYAGEAFHLHASGYIVKPISLEKVKLELENLRYLPEVKPVPKHRMRAHCFGNFELFVDDKPVHFKYNRSKELMAYLIDRNGAACRNAEIIATLFEDDEDHTSYLKSLIRDISNTFKELKCEDVLIRQWGSLAVDTEKLDCDYYDWKKGVSQAINEYNGEYMAQYSWAEYSISHMLDL